MIKQERDFLALVGGFAQKHGWRVAHFRPGRTRKGWRTPCQFDAAGWPDLLLCRGRRLLAAELKSDRGRLTTSQEKWLQALEDAGVSVYCWQPKDWPEIERVLGRD